MNLTNNQIGNMVQPSTPNGFDQYNWARNTMNGQSNNPTVFATPQSQPTSTFTTFQPQPTQPNYQMLPCRVIAPGEEIKAKDVPIDTPSLFVVSDGSCIIGKEWDEKGGIQNTIYIPAPKDPQNQTVNSTEFDQIMQQLNALRSMVEDLKSSQGVSPVYRSNYHKKKPYHRPNTQIQEEPKGGEES